MRAEWGTDQGKSAAIRHRAKLVTWLDKTRAALDAFKPDFVLIWGDDQYENFKEDIVPGYCIAAYDHFAFKSPPDNVWGKVEEFKGDLDEYAAWLRARGSGTAAPEQAKGKGKGA